MFKGLFRWSKKPIKLLGRGGITYNDGKREYYIDSDNMPPEDSGIGVVIFYKGIKLRNDKTPLSEDEKRRIAYEVKGLMEKKSDKVIEISSAG